jgi:hypothetical protein
MGFATCVYKKENDRTPLGVVIVHRKIKATMKLCCCRFLKTVAMMSIVSGSVAITEDDRSTDSYRKDVHILLYESNPDFANDPKSSLSFFKERGETANLHTTVFGGKLQRPGFGDKLQLLKPLLEVVDADQLIIVADAREVALNVPNDKEVATEAVDRFLETYSKLTRDFPKALVMSAEDHCCTAAMSHASPSDYFDVATGTRKERACASGHDDCTYEDNENIANWKEFMQQTAMDRTTDNEEHQSVYLNAGIVAGYPQDFIKVLEMMDLSGVEDDQAVLSGLMYAFPEMIVLDYHQELFGNNHRDNGVGDGCVFEQHTIGSPLYHTEKLTQPLFLHTPGRFYQCLDILIEILGGESHKRYLLSMDELHEMLKSVESPAAESEDELRHLQGEANYGYGNYGYGNYGYGNYGYGNYGNYGYGNYGYG